MQKLLTILLFLLSVIGNVFLQDKARYTLSIYISSMLLQPFAENTALCYRENMEMKCPALRDLKLAFHLLYIEPTAQEYDARDDAIKIRCRYLKNQLKQYFLLLFKVAIK